MKESHTEKKISWWETTTFKTSGCDLVQLLGNIDSKIPLVQI